jgi:acid phosphatase family membrane protein YuiD
MALLLENRALLAALLAWALAQVSKMLIEMVTQRRLNLRRLVSAGGMPSAHSALVVGLTTAVGRLTGLTSVSFAISLVLAGVVMYDAAGVRRAVSIQARMLNQMLEEAFKGHPIGEQRLRELIGHTPVQVLAGGLLGIAVGLLITA